MLMAYGFLRKVFEIFEQYKTPIDMISTSEVAVSLTIDQDANLDKIVNELNAFSNVEIDRNQTIVCIVGHRIGNQKGVLDKIFHALAEIPIRMVSVGGSYNNISILVDTQYKEKTLIQLNQGIFNLA
jgi:aspartate kinase